MSYETKVTRQGQTTIPKPLRERYGIREGDDVTYIDLGDYIAVIPVPRNPLEELKRLQIDVEESAHDMREEAREAARTISEERLRG